MRKRTLGVVLVAGLAISGGSAFTAANDIPDSTAGYGAATVTGATVTDIDYTTTADNSSASAIVFTTTEDLTGTVFTLNLTNGGADVVGDTSSCTTVTVVTTCTFTTAVPLANFDGMNVLVVDADPAPVA